MSEKVKTAFGMVTPAFVPDRWMDGLREAMAESTRKQIRMSYIRQGIDPDNGPTIMVERPLPAEFLAARADFEQRWDALHEEAAANGYVYRDDCGCGGGHAVSHDTTEWVEMPNPDFDPDKPNPYKRDWEDGDTVTITGRHSNVIITAGDPT